jgi:hypothetical protein
MFILKDLRHRQNMVLAQLDSADCSAIFHELMDKQKKTGGQLSLATIAMDSATIKTSTAKVGKDNSISQPIQNILDEHKRK